MSSQIVLAPDTNTDGLQLSSIHINEDYRIKWNISGHDYKLLTMNGKVISNTLYRKGGVSIGKVGDAFFTLLKYTEAQYDDDITTDPKRKPHLKSNWCVINAKGVEVFVCTEFNVYPFVMKDSCIYGVKNRYYNGHNNKFYGYCDKTLESKEYVFLHSKKTVWSHENLEPDYGYGVLQINKTTGEVVNTFN